MRGFVFIITLGTILFCMFGPIVPVLIGSALGFDLDENTTLGTLPWLMFFTVPIGAIVLLVWTVSALILRFLNGDNE